jgi:hypothetical protein
MAKQTPSSRRGGTTIVACSLGALLIIGAISSIPSLHAIVRMASSSLEDDLDALTKQVRSPKQIRRIKNRDVRKNARALVAVEAVLRQMADELDDLRGDLSENRDNISSLVSLVEENDANIRSDLMQFFGSCFPLIPCGDGCCILDPEEGGR